ncbi:PREDICTED: transmembrane channel-like protein 4, partial [Mandrillus leucophaeus]|uniref:transmembrane channel-like protein 4 n=1 Tax=Mandrillus leucophaeus TaxID=9568 RepID=UPI0005F40147
WGVPEEEEEAGERNRKAFTEVTQMELQDPHPSRELPWPMQARWAHRNLSLSLLPPAGQFGAGTESYFSLLRFLLLLNVLASVVMACMTLMPTWLGGAPPGPPGSNTSSPCGSYNPHSQGLVTFATQLFNLLSGEGYLERSPLFYGFYPPRPRLAVTYLCWVFALGLICLLLILHRSVSGLKQTLLAESGDLTSYSHRVFSACDFGPCGDVHVRLCQRIILYELQVELEETVVRRQAAVRTLGQEARVWLVRVLLNLLVIALLGGAFYGIYWATSVSGLKQTLLAESGDLTSYSHRVFLAWDFGLCGDVHVRLCQHIIWWSWRRLVRRQAAVGTLSQEARVWLVQVLLNLLVIALLGGAFYGVYWATESIVALQVRRVLEEEAGPGTYISNDGGREWKFGMPEVLQRKYGRGLLCGLCPGALGSLARTQEFQVPDEVLGLIYAQTVVWVGSVFCPLLPLLNTVKFLPLFYLRKLTLFSTCSPAARTFRASTANFFFPFVLLLGLAISSVPLPACLDFRIPPSKLCGPFREQSSIWAQIPESTSSLPETTQNFLFFLGTQAFGDQPLLLISSILMAYTVARANSYGRLISELKRQRETEAQNKVFLAPRAVALTSTKPAL